MFVCLYPSQCVWRGSPPSNGPSNQPHERPPNNNTFTGYFDATAGGTPASAPASKPSQNPRRWSTKGDIWSFGLSLWSIAEGARPFAHLMEDEVLIAAAGKFFGGDMCERSIKVVAGGTRGCKLIASSFYT